MKACKYCKPLEVTETTKMMISKDLRMGEAKARLAIGLFEYPDEGWVMEGYFGTDHDDICHFRKKIKFCPICGRELKVI